MVINKYSDEVNPDFPFFKLLIYKRDSVFWFRFCISLPNQMMYDMQNYLLSIPNAAKGGIIHDPNTKLKVKVSNLIKSTFKPKKGEVQYFVTAGKKTMAFETVGYQRHRQLLILQMIAWYCVYLGLIEAQIHSTLPL